MDSRWFRDRMVKKQRRFAMAVPFLLRPLLRCLLVVGLAVGAHGLALGRETVPEALRALLGGADPEAGFWVGCERIHADSALLAFYGARGFSPVWVQEQGPTPLFAEFLQVLARADQHGLQPREYHFDCLRAAAARFAEEGARSADDSVSDLAAQEAVMTDAFLVFASHLVAGKVNPEEIYPLWFSKRRQDDVFGVLRRLAEHRDLERAVAELAPHHRGYWRMVRAAAELKTLAQEGGWPTLETDHTLRAGLQDPVMPDLRRRLELSGDLPMGRVARGTIFDGDLEDAVKHFQARHGLQVDGVVGPATRAALNVPVEERWRQVLLNLERWRWLPHHLGERHLLVNTAAYGLEAFEGGRRVLEMRVIVGEEVRRTPVFSEAMKYIEVNPYWNVPPRIAGEEILPRIRKNPAYLAENHYELVRGWEDVELLDPFAISWDRVSPEHLPGRIRQTPGPWNALGRVKFMFPNRFHVYLHDTPNRQLFRRNRRALSHGCIRLEKPMELAVFVLEGDGRWSREALEALVQSGERRTLPLVRPCMVHILYWTAWVDDGGELNFREDIYERDEALWKALRDEPLDAVGLSESPVDPREMGSN